MKVSRSVPVLAALLALPARAQVPDTATLPPVVVTATRVPVAPHRVNAAVTVLSGEDLRRRSIRYVLDALREIPGAIVVPSGSYGSQTSLFLRGGESDYVKVLVDGVPVNDAGGALDLAQFSTDDVDRIEVVRGPASVLYGSDAVTGVVNVITTRGQPGLRLAAAAGGGRYDTRDATISVDGGSGPGTLALTGARHTTSGVLPFNNEYRNALASASVRVTHARLGDARLAARWSDHEYHFPTDESGAPVDSNAVTTDERLVLSLDAGRRISRQIEARLSLLSNDLRATRDNQPDSPGDTSGFYSRSDGTARRLVTDGRLVVSLPHEASLAAGVELSRQTERNVAVSRFARFPADTSRFDARRRNTAGYVELLGSAGRLQLSLGGRHDDNQRFGSFTTWRAALTTAVRGSLRLRLASGTAFKEPAFAEVFTTSSDFSRGNPALRPERSRSVEATLEQMLPRGGRVATTWFDQRFRDMVQYDIAAPAPQPHYRNVGAATARGVEVETSLPVLTVIDLRMSYSYLHTEVTEEGFGGFGTFEKGRSLLRRPRHAASLAASLRASAAHVSLRAERVGSRDDVVFEGFESRRVVLPWYTRLDASAELSLRRGVGRGGGAALLLRLENLTGSRYESIARFPAPGRALFAGARLTAARR